MLVNPLPCRPPPQPAENTRPKISVNSADYFSHPATLFLESPKKREPLRSNPGVDPRHPLPDLPKCGTKRRKIPETSFNSFGWRTLHSNSLIINNLAVAVKM
jgi:hypothetical protein